MARKWHTLAPFYFRATATTQLFFTLAPPQHVPPYSVPPNSGVAKSGASAQHCLKFSLFLQHGQICRVGNLLTSSLAHHSFAHSFKWLRSNEWLWAIHSDRSGVRTNEWLWVWANPSGRSCQKSDNERFAQVVHYKWAHEQIAHYSLIFLKKTTVGNLFIAHGLFIACLRFLYVF